MRNPPGTQIVTKYPNSHTYPNSHRFFGLTKVRLFGDSTVINYNIIVIIISYTFEIIFTEILGSVKEGKNYEAVTDSSELKYLDVFVNLVS